MSEISSPEEIFPRISFLAESLLNFSLNSYQKWIIHAAVAFWNRPMIKEILLKFTTSCVDVSTENKLKGFFVKKAVQKGILIIAKYPVRFQKDLIYSIENVGIRIVEWLLRIVEILQIRCNNLRTTMKQYIDNLIITEEGFIDSSAIFKKIFDDELVDEPYLMYIQACNSCDVNYILKWKRRFVSDKETIIKLVKTMEHHLYPNFYRYWFYLIADENSEIQTTIGNYEILKTSIRSGNVVAVKYFWEKTKKYIKNFVSIRRVATLISSNLRLWTTHSDIFLFFLFQIFEPIEFNNLLLKCEPHGDVYAVMSILPWPWYNITFLFLTQNLRKINTRQYISLFNGILKLPDDMMREIGTDINKIMAQFWKASSPEFKSIICAAPNFMELLLNIFFSSDFEIMKIIINDRDVRLSRQDMIDRSLIFFYKKIHYDEEGVDGNENVENIDRKRMLFECKILIYFGSKVFSGREKRLFWRNIHILYETECLIRKYKFGLAGQMLGLYFNRDSIITEVKDVLCEINIYRMDYGFVLWMIWFEYGEFLKIEECMGETIEFLDFLQVTQSEEELEAFWENLRHSKYLISLTHMLVKKDLFEHFDEMLNCCQLSRDDLFLTRLPTFRTLGERKCIQYIRRNQFYKMKKFLDWCFVDIEDQRDQFLAKLLISREGFILCRNFLMPSKYYKSKIEIIKFFDNFAFLLKKISDVNIIQCILKRWSYDGDISRKYVFYLNLLMKAFHNRYIKLSV